MAEKRKREANPDLTKRIKYFLDKKSTTAKSTPISPESIVDEVLNSPQIVSKV